MTSIKEFIEKITAEGTHKIFVLDYQNYLKNVEALKNLSLNDKEYNSKYDLIFMEKMWKRAYLYGYLSALIAVGYIDISDYEKIVETL